MRAQVGRDGPPVAVGQQALAEQHDDRDRARHQRHADNGEFEIAERPQPGLMRRLGHQHVHRRSGQRQHRAGMRAEHQRHQQLRGRPAEPDRGHDHHRQQRGDRAVHADQRRQHADQQHHHHHQAGAAVARARDQQLPGPGGDAGRLKPRADHEQRGDEDHRWIAEAGQRLAESVSTPVAYSASAVPSATMTTGKRFHDEQHDDARR